MRSKIEKLETSHYKTAMMLFFDLLRKLENDILPSITEVHDVGVKATEAFNFLSDSDLEEKINMSKIRLFCKTYGVLYNEENYTFKDQNLLQPNEKKYVSDLVNAEIKRLADISEGMMQSTFTVRKRASSNLEKLQSFVDEVDQIKKLGYGTIKKEDFSFEHNGKISKYWTLNKNMVPEGCEDALEGLECSFLSSKSEEVTLKFFVYTDLSFEWVVKVSSSNGAEFPSLFAVERNSFSKCLPSVYFPVADKEASIETEKVWRLDMKHLNYPEREVTLIFSVEGQKLGQEEALVSDLDKSTLNSVVEEDLDLIKSLNSSLPIESFQSNASVSMTLQVCNFLDNILVIKEPYFTSGTVDPKHPWPTLVKNSSTSLFFTRKRSLDARGSVGLTVMTVQFRLRLHSFVVHWQAPYDFNLYKNSFVIFPLPGQHYNTSQEVSKIFKNFLDYSNINKEDEQFVGIRGYAKDGPKAMEFCGMLISAKMGVQHNDVLQLSLLPLKSLQKVSKVSSMLEKSLL